jgi:hypothetical protein
MPNIHSLSFMPSVRGKGLDQYQKPLSDLEVEAKTEDGEDEERARRHNPWASLVWTFRDFGYRVS